MIQPIGNRPKAASVDGGHRRHAGRNAEDDDRDQQGGGEAEQGADMSLHFENPDRAEQGDHRDCGQDRRDQRAPGRIVRLATDSGAP
jgi:hypothetical protein